MGTCMAPARALTRFATAFACLVGLALPAFADGWVPLSVGNEWRYRLSQTAEYAVGGQPVSREAKTGRYRREVLRTSSNTKTGVSVSQSKEPT